MTKNQIKDIVQSGNIHRLTYRELRREARRQFWAGELHSKIEGDGGRMPIYTLRRLLDAAAGRGQK